MSTRQEAAQRAEDIRSGLQQTAVLYATAVTEADWQVLGYQSVTQWARCEFGPDRFSTGRRQEIVALLTDAGYTVRQIAQATGAGIATINRDQHQPGVPNGTPGTQPDQEPTSTTGETPPHEGHGPPGNPRQQAARQRETRRRTPRPAQGTNGGNAQASSGPTEANLRHERERLTAAICDQAIRDIKVLLSPDSDLGKQVAHLRDNHDILNPQRKQQLAAALRELGETAYTHHNRILGMS